MPRILNVAIRRIFAKGPRLEFALKVDLQKEPVQILFGPSGSGKTTLLRCLAGLETPEGGEIHFEGETWLNRRKGVNLGPQLRRVAYLSQNPALFPHLNVVSNIAYGLHALSRAEVAQRVSEMVALLELEGLQNRLPHQLSGGQQQRVGLARALASQPRLLLLDEPFSALDAPMRESLRLRLKRLLARLSMPSVMVTHDRVEAFSLGHRIHQIDEGRVLESDATEDRTLRPCPGAETPPVRNLRSLPVQVRKVQAKEAATSLLLDQVAVEEPLEIRLQKKTVSITMRSPGHDSELAAGFLFTEGLVEEPESIQELSPCGPALSRAQSQNIIRVELVSGASVDLKRLERHFYTTSSCGVCGKTSIEALKAQGRYGLRSERGSGPFLSTHRIQDLPRKLREAQAIFDRTGGLHASALFTPEGELLCLREDVGRHNALDKVIGWAFFQRLLPLDQHILLLSGRISFELVQKALMAGIRVIAAVGAPSSLAVELASEMNLTLIGFVRDERFNLYHGDWRIQTE